MTSDDVTPERAREMLAADGQEVTDFTDAILAAWQRDRARLATVTAAVAPFARFAEMVSAKPLRGVASDELPDDKTLYGIHFGTEWEAEITLGHIRAALAAIRAERATTGGTDADE
jgi:hypothetical protein